MESKTFPVQVIPEDQWQDFLAKATRIWHPTKQMGLHYTQLMAQCFDFSQIDIILVRNDDWTLACREADIKECLGLYIHDWVGILKKKAFTHVVHVKSNWEPERRISCTSLEEAQAYASELKDQQYLVEIEEL